MLMEGKILKLAIDTSDYKISEIVDITGISKGQLYNLYKEESIKTEYKSRLEKLNISINWKNNTLKSPNNSGEKVEPGANAYKQAFEAMVRAMAIIEKDHAILSAIVEGAVKDGSLKIVNNLTDVRK